MLPRPGSVYKSLETDREFIARVRLKHPWYAPNTLSSYWLDVEVWDAFKVQRRIVERQS